MCSLHYVTKNPTLDMWWQLLLLLLLLLLMMMMMMVPSAADGAMSSCIGKQLVIIVCSHSRVVRAGATENDGNTTAALLSTADATF